MTQSLDTHFLQSSAWADFQRLLGRKVFTAKGESWSFMAILETGKIGKRLYCPYGPTVTSQDGLKEAITELKSLAETEKCDFIRIEPIGDITQQQILSSGALRAGRDIQPAATWCIDLTKPKEDIVSDMNSTSRNLYRTYSKKGLSITSSDDPADIKILLEFLHQVAKHNSISVHSDEYFYKQAETLLPVGAGRLYFAYFDGRPIASAFVYDSATTRYYAHAAADYEHRKLGAGSPLVSQMIMEAKDGGQQIFDFYGIAPDDDPNHPWAGFSKFKKSFGGQQKDYLGTWEIPLKKLKYKMYNKLKS